MMDAEGSTHGKGSLRYLHLSATAFALAASILGMLIPVLEHFGKPKAGKGNRTNAGTALLGLSVLRMMPSIIKTARMLKADLLKRRDSK